MTDRRVSFRQADLTRVLKGVRAAGFEPSGMRIDPATGAIDLRFPRDGTPDARKDDLDDRIAAGRGF